MRRLLLILLIASLCAAWQRKGKPADIAVIEVKCIRAQGDVALDGRLKNMMPKSITKLNLLIDFLGTDRQVLTTKRGPLDAEQLEAGEEAEFRMRVADPIRAVSFTLRAEDGDGRELRVERAGPFPIE